MTRNAETPRGLTGAFPEDSAAGGRPAATVPQGDALRLVTRGRIEYLVHCPGCAELHRHLALGSTKGPCGALYELQPHHRRG
ncbi:hypothetical protein [Streptomyces marokkonensis]|uniref:hypothetical protein n=1 Tax=Streptomyces marokkonensis TaxID=324855 RepID=UPI0011F151D1|nr:hypothetical protein [Streptomyces marokkonensis]